jgi:hypothetical protein
VDANRVRFKNEQGESFSGFEDVVSANPDVARTRKGKIDLPKSVAIPAGSRSTMTMTIRCAGKSPR